MSEQGDSAAADEPPPKASFASRPTPEQRRNYYSMLGRSIGLRDLAKRLLGERITRESESELLVDCPQHASSSGTSLRIDLHKGLWFCFGCQVGGGALQLVEFIDSGGVTKGAACATSPTHCAARDHLAQLVGAPKLADAGLSEQEITELEAERAAADAVFGTLTDLAEVYHQNLLKQPDVLAWIERKWGFSRDVVERFKFGWADAIDAVAAMLERGHDSAELLATGAFRKDKYGRIWQFFQKRVVIPYFDDGRVVYMIGRRTEWTENNEYEEAKYKKLPCHDAEKHPEVSPAINNRILFGEGILRDRPKRVVIAEGIADCIALQAAGIPSISPATVHIRHRDFERVVEALTAVETVHVVFDSEISGVGGSSAIDVTRALSQRGVSCRVGELPLGPKQQQAHQELAALLGADAMAKILRLPPKARAKEIESVVASKSLDRAKVDALIDDSKVDVAEWFRQGGSAAAFEEVLLASKDYITAQVERLDEHACDEECRPGLERVLEDISEARALDQDRFLAAIKERTRLTLQVLRSEMRRARRTREAAPPDDAAKSAAVVESDGHPYRATEGGLVLIRMSDVGPVEVPLCNFNATIIGHIEYDDGVDRKASFEIEATFEGESKVVVVPAASFALMNWVGELLGPRAILRAGASVKDHVRAAIQFLSPTPVRRTVFTHTGWTRIDGKWVYLFAGGAIGTEGLDTGVDVSLPAELGAFSLPPPPTEEKATEVVRQSLELLDLGPPSVLFALLCGVMRVVIAALDFAQQVTGESGVFKSELLAVIQSFFGAGWAARRLPCNWSSTANAIEAVAFVLKDAVCVVDDFAPNGSTVDVRRMQHDADRVFRAQGNQAGRGRLRPDSTLRATKWPRGTIYSSGEDQHGGHSAQARCLTHLLKKGDIDPANLSVAQSRAASGVYAATMSAYLKWLAPRLDDERAALRLRVSDLREESVEGDHHRRTPSNIAELRAGFEVFVRFCVDTGAIDTAAAVALNGRCAAALANAAEGQAHRLGESEQTGAFLRLLSAAVASGAAYFASETGGKPEKSPEAFGWVRTSDASGWMPRGVCVGWVVGDDLYLQFTGAFKAAQSMASDTEHLAIRPRTLLRRLAERRLLHSQDKSRDRNLIQKVLQGVRRDVAHIRVSTLFGADASAVIGDQLHTSGGTYKSNPTSASEGKGNPGKAAPPILEVSDSTKLGDEIESELRGIVDLFPLSAAQRATLLATLTTWKQRFREHIAIGLTEGRTQPEAETQARGIVIGAFREEIGILLIDAGASGKGASDA